MASASFRKKTLLKVILLGDANVGKTSILNTFIKKQFTTRYSATIGCDFMTSELLVNETLVSLQVIINSVILLN